MADLSDLVLEGYRRLSGPTRGEWVAAMIAERDAIETPEGRRRFSRGCALALLRSPANPDEGAFVLRATVALSVLAAVGLAVFGFSHYPDLRSGSGWIPYVTMFGIGIVAYTFCGLQLSKLGSSAAHRIGIVAALPALPCAWFVAYGTGPISSGVNLIVVLLPALSAVLVARGGGGAAGAAVAAMDTALIAGLLFFVGFVATTYATAGGRPSGEILHEFIRSGASDFRMWSIGDSLGGACFMLALIPIIGVATGLAASQLVKPAAQESMG